jgi:mannose-1-phosphate guanylyltransferase
VIASTPALVLCAGLGTRLRPLTHVRSKPAIPVAGVPMVRRIVTGLAGSGVREIVINLHHLPHTVTAVMGDGSDLDVRVRYSWEQPEVLGSAGGPRQALDIIGADTFLLVNGDTLTDVPIAPLIDAHKKSAALVTMALVRNTHPHRYGGVTVASDGSVTGFVRKGSPEPSYHFIGVQVANRQAFDRVPAGAVANSTGEVYDSLIAERPGSVRAHVCEARFWDVGTVADYWETSHAFAGHAQSARSRSATCAPSARVLDSIVWDDVRFGDGCHVERCIVTDGVSVPAGAMYADAILLRDADGQTMAEPFSREQR